MAQVGDRAVTRAAFEVQWQRRNGITSREALLTEMIRQEALVQAARAQGLDRSPEMLERFDKMVASAFLEQQLEPLLRQAGEVSEAETLAYYDQHRQEFTLPEQVRAGVIFIKAGMRMDADRRAALRTRALQLHASAQIARPEEFKLLVQEHSEHQATRYQGGDAGWLAREATGAWDQAVIAAVFALHHPGEVAPLVESETGYHIVRLIERRVAQVQPLDRVAEAIRYRLARQKKQAQEEAFYASILRGLTVATNQAAFDSLRTPAEGMALKPPNVPGK